MQHASWGVAMSCLASPYCMHAVVHAWLPPIVENFFQGQGRAGVLLQNWQSFNVLAEHLVGISSLSRATISIPPIESGEMTTVERQRDYTEHGPTCVLFQCECSRGNSPFLAETETMHGRCDDNCRPPHLLAEKTWTMLQRVGHDILQ